MTISSWFYLLEALFVVFCLLGRAAAAEPFDISAEPPGFLTSLDGSFLPPFDRAGIVQETEKPVRSTFRFDFGPKAIELKTVFLEKREGADRWTSLWEGTKRRRHFDLLASSSLFGGKLVAEGELAYTSVAPLKTEAVSGEYPKMLRLGLNGRLGSLSYGADYRSLDAGFVTMAGARFDQARDELQLWGERGLGPFRLRASIGELWEVFPEVEDLRRTRTAGASLSYARPHWGATLASTYSLLAQGVGSNQEAEVFTNTLTGSYRPFNTFAVTPNFTVKEERDQSTGIWTENQSAGLMFVYTPWGDWLRFNGSTSYARSFTRNDLKDISAANAGAGLGWRIGRSRRGEAVLSFKLEYHRQIDFNSSSNSHENFSGMLQFKFTGL